MILLILYFSFIGVFCSDEFHRRFEYKFGFKGPQLAQSDQTIPFWSYSGDVIVSEDSLRLTPSLRSKKGRAWSNNISNFSNWEVEVFLRVTGRGRIGADGMAIWFTKEKGSEGAVFGSNDMWNGLAVFLDSFDNDGKKNNPSILAVVNDGTLTYDHESDGFSQQLGGCVRDFRNRPFPVRVKISRRGTDLEVFVNDGLRQDHDAYELCFSAHNVELPEFGHFGVSAATGAIADDQDVLAFLTTSLTSLELSKEEDVSKDMMAEIENNFRKYERDLESARKSFENEHPSTVGDAGDITSQEKRELSQVFEGQSRIYEVLHTLSDRQSSMLGRMIQMDDTIGAIKQDFGNMRLPAGNAHSEEASKLAVTMREAVSDVRHVSEEVRHLKEQGQRLEQLLSSNSNIQGSLTLHEILDGVKMMRNNMDALVKLQTRKDALDVGCTGCVGPFTLYFLLGCQCVILSAYVIYRFKTDAQPKKFY